MEKGKVSQGRCMDERGKYSWQEMGQRRVTKDSELESRVVIRYVK